jgi:cell division inhibitor SepF
MISSFLSKISKFFGLDPESEFDDFESDVDEYEGDVQKKHSQFLNTAKAKPSYHMPLKEKLTRSSVYKTKKEKDESSLVNSRLNEGPPKIQNNEYAQIRPRHLTSSSKSQSASQLYRKGSNVVSMQQAAQKVQTTTSAMSNQMNSARKLQEEAIPFKIAINEPRVYSEALSIANLLLAKEAVLINFHLMEEVAAARVIDFLTGVIFALDGDIQRVDNEIFLVTPNNMKISGDAARNLLNQANVN